MSGLPVISIPSENSIGGFTPGGTTSQMLDGAGNAIDHPPTGFVGAAEILTALASGKYAIFPLSSVSGTNTIAATFGATLAAGQFFCLIPAVTNTSTTVNLNLDAGGNKRIKGPDGFADPAVGDLVAGRINILYYDGTAFRQLLGAPGSIVLSSVSGTNTITANSSAPPLAGMFLILTPANTNSGAVTLNVNSTSGVAIKQADGNTALAAGDLVANKVQVLYFDGTVYRLLTGGLVSASDSSKVPLAGTSSLTGPLGWSSNSGSGTSSAVWIGKDASGPIVNVGSWGNGGGLQVCAGNTLNMYLNETYGIVYYVDQASLSSVHQKIRSSGGFEENVPSGKSYTYKVAGAAVGHWPLTPSDLPAIRFDAPLVNGQSLSFGDYNYLQTGTPTTNNLFTVSGTGNITFTSLYAGVLEIYVSIAADKEEGMLRVEKNGSFVREGFVNAFVNRVTIATAVPIAIGDVIKMNAYSSGSATISVGSGAGTLFMALRS